MLLLQIFEKLGNFMIHVTKVLITLITDFNYSYKIRQ